MIDLHCHLLPGIDDGPASLEQSLAMARLACNNGITHAVLTPHVHPGRYANTAQSIKVVCDHYRQALKENGIDLQVGFAGEVRLTDEILPLIQNEQVPFYGEFQGYRIMLLELPHSHVPAGSEKFIQWLLDRKIRPMIAHPERNKGIIQSIDRIRPFIEMECLFQLTAGSVAGLFGEPARDTARQLLEMGCVTVLASDAHNLERRQPRLDHGMKAAAEILGLSETRKMVVDYPRMLAASQFDGSRLL